MRRKQKRVPNLAQGTLPIALQTSQVEQPKSGRSRFQDDRPEHLRIGAQRLDEYLSAGGLGWVMRLRRELEHIDFTPLVTGYDMMGRRPYHPRTILGLIVYGMLCRQWSLRELEVLAVRDMGAWWICGGLQPDHSTIGDFIHRHRSVLTEDFFVALVAGLVRRAKLPAGVVAGDGTVVQAATSQHRMLTVEAARAAAECARANAAQQPADAAAQATAAQAQEVAAVAQQRVERRHAAKQRAIATPCVAPSEPTAVVQRSKNGTHLPSYKPTTLVHESGLIVAQQGHPSSETATVNALLDQHVGAFGVEPITALFDAGFHSGELLEHVAERGIDILCPPGKPTGTWRKRNGPRRGFDKAAFTYDALANVYHCPASQTLRSVAAGVDRAGRAYQSYGGAPCRQCALRAQCTTSATGREVIRYAGDEFKECMAEVLLQPAARKQFRRRRCIVERPFAELRYRQGLTRFHRRGILGVRVEFALHCIAFNLKWAISDERGTFIVIVRVLAAQPDGNGTLFALVLRFPV
jgi:hypothetical protein